MATETPATSAPTKSDETAAVLDEIETHVGKALSELFSRAHRENAVRDRKPEGEAEGLVQDCEFGMILLLGRAWLRQRNALSRVAPILQDENAVEAMVVKLVKQTVTAVLKRRHFDQGGDNPGSRVYFTGAPYTRIKARKDPFFSANLDAAMLVLSFLAPALREYHNELGAIDVAAMDLGAPPISEGPTSWIKNLRHLALYICRSGAEYAQACQVRLSRFEGFTCDPNSIFDDGKASPYLDRFDRLFFTWTASETAHDLLQWLAGLPALADGVPPEEVVVLRAGVEKLNLVLDDAAQWCKDEFLAEFSALKPPVDMMAVVQKIQRLGEDALDPQLNTQREQLQRYVQHAYHLSHYAAIRSLSPARVDLQEVAGICDRLDTLVGRDVIGSGLDGAKTETLFSTLTRSYRLGRGIEERYSDDAYYPLIVRSMSGLLSRTMETLGERATNPADILKLVGDFKRVLKAHYANLVARRPERAEDAALWSFAFAEPYVLYATQRTLFALLTYSAFLEKMDAFERSFGTDEALERSIKDLLTQALIDNLLGPAVRDIVSTVKAQGIQPGGTREGSLLLPKPEWAAEVVRGWLKELVEDFERSRLENDLQADAAIFLTLREWALEESGTGWPEAMRKNHRTARQDFEKLMTRYGFSDVHTPTAEELVPHLLRDLFASPRLSTRMNDQRYPLPWRETVDGAKNTQTSVKNFLETRSKQ